MTTSQNGWPIYTSGTHSDLVSIPWVTGRVRKGDVATIFDHLCRRFNAEVEPIRKDWSWGYAYRPIRGATTFSNHASATAIDVNAPDHPMGKADTFSPAKQAKIREIVAEFEGVIFWGGEWENRPDDMHFEIRGTAARVARVAAKITGGAPAPAPAPTPGLPSTGVSKPAPKPALPKWDGKSFPGAAAFKSGQRHAAVKVVQERLKAHGYNPGAIDSYWGPVSNAATRRFQQAQGWRGADADGIPGPETWRRLMAAPKAKPAPKPAGRSIAQMAQEVIDGKHGTGHANRQRSLGVSTSTYQQVRDEVNRRVSGKTTKPAKSISQMAAEVIAGKHGTGHEARRRSLGIDATTYAKVRAEVNRRV